MPLSTVREQKKAQRDQANSKTGSDLRTKESTTKETLIQKYSQKRTSDKGGVNLKKKSGADQTMSDALARIDEQLKQREVKLTAGQANSEDTGQSPYGSDKGTAVDPALIMYYNTIKRKINNEWMLSKSDFTGALQTKIIVMIDENGNILRTSFKKGSGDGSFDASAMRAIRRSAPFPIPPDSIRHEALTEGFLIEFNPESVTGRI